MASFHLGSQSDIQIIDFKPFLDGSNKTEVAKAILDSFKETGFVYLVNHGVPQNKIDGMFEWSKRFFAQPVETKKLAPHPPIGTHHRGYSHIGMESVSQHVYDPNEQKKLRAKSGGDMKESFECGREDDKIQPNIWLPEGVLPGFQEACLDFFWLCREVVMDILRALEVGFDLTEGYLTKFHTQTDNQLRLLHYPSVPTESLEKDEIVRISAHSDYGSITLLFQDDIGGLEIEDPKKPGSFKPATPVPGSMIVNAGDCMARWSNDIIRSTVHRVRAPPNLQTKDGMTPERYSIPYFCSSNFDDVVDCLPGTFSDEKPKKYEPISGGEYFMKRLATAY
ncbi:thymine dioxygenase [Dendrothele bispora CBS 962.96]|uniref:Thymine dioxygenase n=2 Tax=Dendrothele bispora (strain CBS 962.96) TaxID=1314807 RepID=A0A4S8L086_DENBC|nr:thymine dioxygenase [Dendrothele bispora CBS 962.96]